MTEEHEVVIQFRNVTKTFDLFKNDKQRLKSLLFHNTNAKKKVAIDNLSLISARGRPWRFWAKMAPENPPC